MDTLLRNGDHATDPRGLPMSVTGAEELIQRAMIRLAVRKGSFPYDEKLGSELWRISRDDSDATRRAAHSYVQEALLPLPELMVEDVSLSFPEPDILKLTVELRHEGTRYLLELTE